MEQRCTARNGQERIISPRRHEGHEGFLGCAVRTGKFFREARKGRKAKTNVISSGREKSFSSPGDVGGLGARMEQGDVHHGGTKDTKV